MRAIPTRRELVRSTSVSFLLAAVLFSPSLLQGQCWSPNFSPGLVYKTTGDIQLDQKFNTEGNLIHRVFGVSPNMVVFDDGSSPNAFASPQNTMPGYSGTVYFGLGLLRNQLWSMDKGEAAVAGIMAHEFAHILQLQMGSQLSGKYRELDADFMAGYYLRAKSYVTRADIEPFARSLFQTGDYNFRSPTFHGTPDQRVSAMLEGYNTVASLSSAFEAGQKCVLGKHGESPSEDEESRNSGAFTGHSSRADSVAADDTSSEFCKDLHVYVRAAGRNFSELRGVPQPEGDGEAFDARRGVSGFTDCTIWIYRDRSLEPSASCDHESEADFSSLRSLTAACLGDGWSSRNRNTSGDAEYIFSEQNGIDVRIRKKSSGKIELWVDSPERD